MDLEELIGTLFVLYILGSVVAGFFRRGSRSSDDGARREDGAEQPTGRPGFPDVLDMDELERRLREIRTGRWPRDEAAPQPPAPSPVPTASTSTPAPTVTSPRMPAAPEPAERPLVLSRTSHPATARPARTSGRPVPSVAPVTVSSAADPGDYWDELPDASWEAVSQPTGEQRPESSGKLPAAVEMYMQQGNPWQAAFVIKELLGPPRALQPHSRRPRF